MKPKVIVALAREMAGFVWAMLHLVPGPTRPSATRAGPDASPPLLGPPRRGGEPESRIPNPLPVL